FIASFQKIHIIRTLDETDMRQGPDEFLRLFYLPVFNEIGPELPGLLELLVDHFCLFNIDGAVLLFHCIVNSHRAACPVPALFLSFELSIAGLSNLSNNLIFQSGSIFLSSVAKVVLRTPAPIRITSFDFLLTILRPPFQIYIQSFFI